MKKLYFIFLLTFLSLGFVACNDDDNKASDVTIGLNIDSPIEGMTVQSGTLTFYNISTGVELAFPYKEVAATRAAAGMTQNILDGLYNVTFVGTGSYLYTYERLDEEDNLVTESTTVEKSIQGNALNVQIIGGQFELNLNIHVVEESSNFVIAEIFGAGHYHVGTTKQYNGDQYIRIHNNSSETLYADSLVILESKFTTTIKFDYNPNIMGEAMTVQVVAMIPGSGRDYPVAPGKSIIVCDNAINHTIDNSDSFDLSGADFEWFTTGSTSNPDADNPEVTNLNMIYNYTKTVWILNKQGTKTYAIGRLGKDVTSSDDYLERYAYEYDYVMATGVTSKKFTEYKFPNEWIIDAVNLSPKTTYKWGVVDSSLDLGFSYFGVTSSIAENIGKGAARKVISSDVATGQVFYQDTNNSSIDFVPNATPTLAN